MPLQQSTPASTRFRWQGTRTAFVDLVESLARCIGDVVAPVTSLRVKIGDHEGSLSSTQDLRTELTESLWLNARRITVNFNTADWKDASASLILEPLQPVLFVAYSSGTPQARETLRAVVERRLPPETVDPRRRWRWIGPILGCIWFGTAALIGSRLPPLGLKLRASATAHDLIYWVSAIALIALTAYWTRLALQYWFPPLERLPDTAKSRWDRSRAWRLAALGVWATLIIGLLALPVRH